MFASLLLYGIVVVLPVVCWYAFIRWQDRNEPEPRKFLRKCVYATILGMAVAMFAEVFLSDLFGLDVGSVAEGGSNVPFTILALSVFAAGPIEELIKYLVLRYSVYFLHDFNQVFDGIVYGITIALTFSMVENTLYFISLGNELAAGAHFIAVYLRGLLTTAMHVAATGIVGYYVGMAKFSAGKRSSLLVQGVIIGSCIHGAFNVLISVPTIWGSLGAILLITISLGAFIRLWNKPEVRMVWQYVPNK